jgi:tetratricopeptide (TPR) repeat protein
MEVAWRGLHRRWLEKRLLELRQPKGPVVLVDDGLWGTSYLIDALRECGLLVWLELSDTEKNDPDAQWRKLANAFANAIGGDLFEENLSQTFGLKVLKQHLHFLEPLSLVISGADLAPEFCEQLCALHQERRQVIFHLKTLSAKTKLFKKFQVIDAGTLALSKEELEHVIMDGFDRTLVTSLYTSTKGAYTLFLKALAEKARFLAPLEPVAFDSATAKALQTPALLKFLLGQGRHAEALELAVKHHPDQVDSVLQRAGKKLWLQEDSTKLYTLLGQMPENYRSEIVLSTRLYAALEVDKQLEMMEEVEAFLAHSKAPELRALYAETLRCLRDVDRYLEESQKALGESRTPITLLFHGSALSIRNPNEGLSLLKAALHLTEMEGELALGTCIAWRLSEMHNTLGYYQAAANYADWGLKWYTQEGLTNTRLQALLLNEYAFSKVLIGETFGLQEQLQKTIIELNASAPETSLLLQSTLADVFFSQENSQTLPLYQKIWNETKRRELASYTVIAYIRALLEEGEYKLAEQIAEQAVTLTENLPIVFRRNALLAHGMALSIHNKQQSLQILENVLEAFSEPLMVPQQTQAALYMIYCHLALSNHIKANELLERFRHIFAELGRGGMRYLAGPTELFQDTFTFIKGERSPLALHFLDGSRVRHQDSPLELRPRFADILAALALHPEGLSAEQLTLAVYGEDADPATCMADVSRLKKSLPVSSKPYRLEVGFWADFLEVEKLLELGKLREALHLYKHPLLPTSEAPAIRQYRDLLEESLRQTVLSSRDANILFTLAQQFKSDLELWEATLEVMAKNDPRYGMVEAQVKQVHLDWNTSINSKIAVVYN